MTVEKSFMIIWNHQAGRQQIPPDGICKIKYSAE